ncbi:MULTISPECIES: tRNA glutamyl-Q(34) synthetase GluQRS [Giesbergeria]|uniref:Glutamyl-Q tRNA(Asp) synthetase n=1 Tax=Giesbergeria sinuosa TaxID=80883 RepID=A0ABV9QFU0_9BURK
MNIQPVYVGRFAPSPTGPLHAGSLVAALASWLDARAWNQGRGGRWLVRIEDIDTPRCMPGAADTILHQLATCGLQPDAPPLRQSSRSAAYQQALDQLAAQGLAYPCACSRKDIAEIHAAQGQSRERHALMPYPGTCRQGLHGRTARAWRFNTQDAPTVTWNDRRLGPQQQNVAQSVGDFVLRRADGLWAYQLAVVVDDGAQGITHIVRGEDLADNTPRQMLLQQALGLPTPHYLHTPLVCAANGEKLSKQHGAPALDLRSPLQALSAAAQVLQLPKVTSEQATLSDALALWIRAWTHLYNQPL